MWASTPIINYVMNTNWSPEEMQTFQNEMMAMHSAHHHVKMKAVDWMKSKLGRQSYTMTTFRRLWVWEREGWRVYVNNDMGIAFEVQEGLTKTQVKEQWDDFRKKLGLV